MKLPKRWNSVSWRHSGIRATLPYSRSPGDFSVVGASRLYDDQSAVYRLEQDKALSDMIGLTVQEIAVQPKRGTDGGAGKQCLTLGSGSSHRFKILNIATEGRTFQPVLASCALPFSERSPWVGHITPMPL
jgi:hypothetical protein